MSGAAAVCSHSLTNVTAGVVLFLFIYLKARRLKAHMPTSQLLSKVRTMFFLSMFIGSVVGFFSLIVMLM